METTKREYPHQRLTQYQKDSGSKQWYKDNVDLFSINTYSPNLGYGGVDEYTRKKVNYDLFNDIINLNDFAYVCKPYGEWDGEMPAQLTNRDISANKLRVLIGEEVKRPTNFKVVALNDEVTSAKEKEKFQRIKDFVVESLLAPIREQAQNKYQRQIQQLQQQLAQAQSPEEQQQIQMQLEEATENLEANMEQEVKAMTPREVHKYMEREHQDPIEALGQQLLTYLSHKEQVRRKFNKGFKHALLAGEEIYWVGIVNGEPALRVINPLFFDYDKSPDIEWIHEGEWAVAEYRMTPNDVVNNYGDQLTPKQIDDLYTEVGYGAGVDDWGYDLLIDESESIWDATNSRKVRVVHAVWKSLRKIGFLTYIDEEGLEQVIIVPENYKLDKEAGDLKIDWEWIPETHEATRIGKDVYVNMRPVPNQYKDIDNLYSCKLPFIGVAYDNLNSETTSLMDRMKSYQYFYNIIAYRIEMLMASDKGKKFLANINMIPASSGMDINKWLYFLESTGIAWIDPNEEGNRGQGTDPNAFRSIDLSVGSDLDRYINLAQYIDQRCGEVAGISKQREGQISPTEGLGTARHAITQSAHITEEIFFRHNNLKREALTALLECAKLAYSGGKQKKLSYVLDDMSVQMLTIDPELLTNADYGVFLSDSGKDAEVYEMLKQLSHAALQNQQIELSDIVKILKGDNIQQVEEELKVAEKLRQERNDAMQKQQLETQERINQSQLQDKKDERDSKERMNTEDNQTKITVAEINSFKFQRDQDLDNNGIPDQLELMKFKLQEDMNNRKMDIEERNLKLKEEQEENKMKDREQERKLKKELSKSKGDTK